MTMPPPLGLSAQDVDVDQEAAAGDDLLAAAEEAPARRTPRSPRSAGDRDRDDSGRCAGRGRDCNGRDLAAPDLDRAGLRANGQRPDGPRLDHLLALLQLLRHRPHPRGEPRPVHSGFTAEEPGRTLRAKGASIPDLELTSTAFDDGDPIPQKYTCDGDNVSPPLSWRFVPEEAASLALIVHDPDAPSGDVTHWLAWNIDPGDGEIAEGVPAPAEGTNARGAAGYMGPCPPEGHGPHRYFFRLHAIEGDLDPEPGAAREQLEAELEGRVLAEAQLMGTYERQG